MTDLFSPPDMMLANEVFKAACGHGALAAALGIRVMDVMQYFDDGGWVNIPIMKAAIFRATCAPPIKRPLFNPWGRGVLLVQWLGRWMEPQVPAAARCAHRHWVAFNGGYIWDSNTEKWMATEAWEKFLPELYCDKTTGHKIDSLWVIR